MPTLLDDLTTKVSAAFEACGYPRDCGAVRLSDRPDLAQFQCNGAMAAAKAVGKNPREVAAQVAEKLSAQGDLFAKIDVAGPGFLNITLTDTALTSALAGQNADPHHGVPQNGAGARILLDYGGPNAAKAMHVGHLRSAIIGDTLRRIFMACGYEAVGDIHLGDWGLQAGHVISELEIRHPDWPYFAHGATGPFDGFMPPLAFDDLGEIYPAASAAAKADPARLERSRAAVLALQQKHAGYNALWGFITDLSKQAMRTNYGHLNVTFDLWKGERDVDHLIPEMVEDLKARKFAVQSDGAWVVPVAQNDDKKEMPPLILVKSDGAYLYSTTDLATIIDRAAIVPPLARVIILADQRQSLHFEQVFRAARLAGYVQGGMDLVHAGFGTMNGTDGKPFKTRAGGVLRLEDLISMAHDKARARMNESHVAEDMTPDEQENIARMIAVAAVKFADLKNPRHVDYVFDLDAMTSFEGKTGPYLLYQAVRIRSILSRARAQNMNAGAVVVDETSRELSLILLDYPNIVAMAAANLTPHVLADYLHRLSQEFAGFYNRCHILSENDPVQRGAWLALCQMTLDTLVHGLGLMGIDVPDKM